MSADTTLGRLGWNRALASAAEGLAGRPARVVRVDRGGVLNLLDAGGAVRARLSPRFRRESDPTALPTVGDWVVVGDEQLEGDPVIDVLLPRRSAIVRRTPADRGGDAQVLAANVDTMFIVAALDEAPQRSRIGSDDGRGVNQRRLDRYVALAWDSGVRPVVVLSKADRCPEPGDIVRAVAAASPGVDVHALSARTGHGVEALRDDLRPGTTVALLGMSGAGKSTLANRLLGEDTLATREVRDDDRGRHTTTARHLLVLPGGALLIDTPGLRELALWDADEGLADAFEDIEALAAGCRFGDCAHDSEPGCAVQAALAAGTLPAERFDSYLTLQREQAHLARRLDVRLRKEEERRWREINRSVRSLRRFRGH